MISVYTLYPTNLWSRILFENPVGAQGMKNFHVFWCIQDPEPATSLCPQPDESSLHLLILFHLCLYLPSCILPSDFLFEVCMHSCLSHVSHVLHLSRSPWFDCVQIMKFIIMHFSPSSTEVIPTVKLKNNNLLMSLLAFHVGD